MRTRTRPLSRRVGRGTRVSSATVVLLLTVAAVSSCSVAAPVGGDTPTASIAAATPDTAAPSAADSPTVAGALQPTPLPTPALPSDPCHAGGVTYCALNPDVTQATIGTTICVKGWTTSVRPPESYTYNLKKEQIAQEGLPGGTSNYEEDHRMPLELGGAPSDVMNLSPESPPSPNAKDSEETNLKYDVCDGRMTLVQAQQQMVSTWLAAYPGYRR